MKVLDLTLYSGLLMVTLTMLQVNDPIMESIQLLFDILLLLVVAAGDGGAFFLQGQKLREDLSFQFLHLGVDDLLGWHRGRSRRSIRSSGNILLHSEKR